jgi:hypothetical protein
MISAADFTKYEKKYHLCLVEATPWLGFLNRKRGTLAICFGKWRMKFRNKGVKSRTPAIVNANEKGKPTSTTTKL